MLRMILIGGSLIASSPALAGIATEIAPDAVPEEKRTTLGLYVTAEEAASAMSEDDGIILLDIRDPIEIQFVGLADPVDVHVPFRIGTHDFDEEEGRYVMAENEAFLDEVAAVLEERGADADATIFVICRSGDRTAEAVDALAAAGYGEVWSIIDGFEGDPDEEGRRTVNGWKNAGLPWGYGIPAEIAWERLR